MDAQRKNNYLFQPDFIPKDYSKPKKVRSKTPRNIPNTQDDTSTTRYSSPQKPKNKSSASQHQFTVPRPFDFDTREKVKPKTIRQQKVEEMILEKQLEEEFHIRYRSHPHPIPAEVLIPKYQTLLATQEARRLEVKRNSKAITEKLQRPFNFHGKERAKEEPQEEKYVFKARPPPPTNNLPLFDQMSKQLEEQRKSRIEAAAKKSLEEAKMPSRMERYSKGDKNLDSVHPSITAFKAKKPPEFRKLWEDMDKEMENKKSKFEPTKPKEFNFAEIKKKVKAVEMLDEVQQELVLKGFGAMLKKVVNLDPPAELPKSTKKQQMAEDHRKKQGEDLRLQDERMKQEEEERKRKYEEAKQRVKQSGSIQTKTRSEEEEKKQRTIDTRQRQKEEAERAESEKQRMMERVNQRPLVSDTISSFYSKTNNSASSLATIKQKMLQRGVQPHEIAGEVSGFENIYAEDLV